MKPIHMTRIVDRKRYDTKKASLIAHDAFWDGSNFERSGRNMFLYKTQNGSYFLVTLTQWQGERDSLEPVSQEEAIRLYEEALPEHEMPYEEAFPDVTILEA